MAGGLRPGSAHQPCRAEQRVRIHEWRRGPQRGTGPVHGPLLKVALFDPGRNDLDRAPQDVHRTLSAARSRTDFSLTQT